MSETTLSAEERERLKTLAEKATKGNWSAGECFNGFIPGVPGPMYAVFTDAPCGEGRIRATAITGEVGGTLDGQSRADAEYLAQCSPSVVLALLAERDRLAAELAEARKALRDERDRMAGALV